MGCVARRLQPTPGGITGVCWKEDNTILAEGKGGRRGMGNGQSGSRRSQSGSKDSVWKERGGEILRDQSL